MATNSPQSPECLVLQTKFARLVKKIAPIVGKVARESFSRNFITSEQLNELENPNLSEDSRASKLLRQILTTIEENPKHFEKFLSIVDSIRIFKGLGDELKEEIRKMKEKQPPRTQGQARTTQPPRTHNFEQIRTNVELTRQLVIQYLIKNKCETIANMLRASKNMHLDANIPSRVIECIKSNCSSEVTNDFVQLFNNITDERDFETKLEGVAEGFLFLEEIKYSKVVIFIASLCCLALNCAQHDMVDRVRYIVEYSDQDVMPRIYKYVQEKGGWDAFEKESSDHSQICINNILLIIATLIIGGGGLSAILLVKPNTLIRATYVPIRNFAIITAASFCTSSILNVILLLTN